MPLAHALKAEPLTSSAISTTRDQAY